MIKISDHIIDIFQVFIMLDPFSFAPDFRCPPLPRKSRCRIIPEPIRLKMLFLVKVVDSWFFWP